MARTSIYLNFQGKTEEAFIFYKSIIGGDFIGEVARSEKNTIIHIELKLLGDLVLMGSDSPESVNYGNNIYINLEPDSKAEADRLFDGLSVGGKIETLMQDVFWGAYYGSCVDKYGVRWMINFAKT